MNTKMNWKSVLTIGGAFAAYCIGAGFASGQEILQYYVSWGGIYPFILPVLTFTLLVLFCYGTYKTGCIRRFPDPNVAYSYYCGKVLGKVLDIFCTLSIPLSKLVNFIYPLIGAAGIVIFVGILIKMFTDGSIPAAQE